MGKYLKFLLYKNLQNNLRRLSKPPIIAVIYTLCEPSVLKQSCINYVDINAAKIDALPAGAKNKQKDCKLIYDSFIIFDF